MENEVTVIKTEEQLIERRGYLRVPVQFRQMYGSPLHYNNPTAIIETVDGKVRLVYEWPEGDVKKKT